MSIPSNLSNKLITTNALWNILEEVTNNIYNNIPQVDISGKANRYSPTFTGSIQLGNGIAIGNNTTAMGSGTIYNLQTIAIDPYNKKRVTLAAADRNYDILPGDILYHSTYGTYLINSYESSSGTIALFSDINTNSSAMTGWKIKQGPIAYGADAHAEGTGTNAIGNSSHAEGNRTSASGYNSHTEGTLTQASGDNAHAEGRSTKASDYDAHAEGANTTASGVASHAEGDQTTASSNNAHAEGANTTASARSSHAEGYHTTVSQQYSHAEGSYTTASGEASHAEGHNTIASGQYSHSEGEYTVATGGSSHVVGKYNIEDIMPYWASNTSYKVGDIIQAREGYNDTTFDNYECIEDHVSSNSFDLDRRKNYWKYIPTARYVEIVGNGTAEDARSNARTLDWDGNEWLAGNITVNGGSLTLHDQDGDVTITAAQLRSLLATLQ